MQVFEKDSSFDPRADPIVRVQARRLRARLASGTTARKAAGDPIVIELPKGGYAPVFKAREAPARRAARSGTALAGQNTIAVMPFADHSPGQELAYFCEGLRQETIHRLATVKALRMLVAGRRAPTQPRAPGLQRPGRHAARPAASASRASGCGSRCTWSTAQRLRICGPNPSTRAWPTSSPRRRRSPAPCSEAWSRVWWTPPSAERRRPTENLAARNLYLQGRYHLNQRTDEGLQKALEFFEKAIVEDAQFALAHSGLADAHEPAGALRRTRQPAHAWAKAASSAATAVDARRQLCRGAHVARARQATQDWDWAGAEREFLARDRLDPRYATAHHWYAMSCLVPMARLDEALDEMRVAQSLDPVSSIVARDLAIMHCLPSRLRSGARAVRPHDRAEPALLAGLLGAWASSRNSGRTSTRPPPHFSGPSTSHRTARACTPGSARALALWGRTSLATAALRKLESMARQRYVSPFEFAVVRFGLGQHEVAYRWLTKACEHRAFDVLALKVDPRFQALQDDARLRAIVKDIGLL